MRFKVLEGVLALSLAGCTPIGAPQPVGAAVFASTAVAATVAKRKVDGGCLANCSKGWHCDERRGLCVADEERASAPAATLEPVPEPTECRPPLRCDSATE